MVSVKCLSCDEELNISDIDRRNLGKDGNVRFRCCVCLEWYGIFRITENGYAFVRERDDEPALVERSP